EQALGIDPGSPQVGVGRGTRGEVVEPVDQLAVEVDDVDNAGPVGDLALDRGQRAAAVQAVGAAPVEGVDDLAVAKQDDALGAGGDEADVARVAGLGKGSLKPVEVDEPGGQRLVDRGPRGQREGLLPGIDGACA